MVPPIDRRNFLKLSAGAGAVCLTGPSLYGFAESHSAAKLISPGCRTSKVKVARLYIGNPSGLWPKPELDFRKEIKFYESKFRQQKDELADVDFPVDELVTSAEQVAPLASRVAECDGILVIHLSLGVWPVISSILELGRPTMVFARPYSGHEWSGWGAMRAEPIGAKMECLLTSDYSQLAAAIRPFRAIHHLREAKILNLSTRDSSDYTDAIKEKFGTELKQVSLDRVLDLYNSIPDRKAESEADRWMQNAVAVVEPSREDVVKSCRLAFAFEKLLDEEKATVMTADCYGTMHGPLCQKYAYPCVGFTRLNDMGLGGICESDLRCAVTHILYQGLSGRPGFISDPTVDESDNSIILAHCLGTRKMAGPDKAACPYKLRTIMERREGVVPQVMMDTGQKVTQSILLGTDTLRYFTGEIIEVPDTERGCRTKIKVRVDGDVTKLWHNWRGGLHRQTCYGDITSGLRHFCRFKEIEMINEAV